MASTTCGTCHRPVPPTARFCGTCGSATSADQRTGASTSPGPFLEAQAPDDVDPAAPAAVVAPDAGRGAVAGPDTLGGARPDTHDGLADEHAEHDEPVGGRWARHRRLVLAALTLALAAAAVVAAVPGEDAIVVGDGLRLASGTGPSDAPSMSWDRTIVTADLLPPVVAASTVVVAGEEGGRAGVLAFDRGTGERLWGTVLGTGPPVSLLRIDGDVVVTATDGELTTVTRLAGRTGEPRWTEPVALPGGAVGAWALPDGRTVVELTRSDDAPGGATGLVAVVTTDGGPAVTLPAADVAVSVDTVALLEPDRTRVTLLGPDGPTDATGLLVGDDPPIEHVALLDGAVVTAAGSDVRAVDVATGEQRWLATAPGHVLALVPGEGLLGVVTASGEHVLLDPAGVERSRGAGVPLPLVRDGEPVAALVAPGTGAAAVEVTVVDGRGRTVETATAAQGAYLALGGRFLLTGVGTEIRASPIDGVRAAPWAIELPRDSTPRWVVLDGPTMLVVGETPDGSTLTAWS